MSHGVGTSSVSSSRWDSKRIARLRAKELARKGSDDALHDDGWRDSKEDNSPGLSAVSLLTLLRGAAYEPPTLLAGGYRWQCGSLYGQL